MEEVTAGDALEKVRALAAARAVEVARRQVWTGARPLSFDDVRNALVYAVGCAEAPDGRHVVVGVDLDSEVLRLTVEIGDVLRVVHAEREGEP